MLDLNNSEAGGIAADRINVMNSTASSNRETWLKWMEITRAVDDSRGLSLLADCDCAESIGDEKARENASRALISATCVLLEKAAALLPEIEPRSSGEVA